ncbi:hypothetical protein Tco_1302181 [Tanacetum coccineum]
MRGCVLKKGLFGVVSEQDELPSSVGLDFRARLDGGRMARSSNIAQETGLGTKLTTGRLVNGSSCDGIDMVIKNLDLELKDIIAEFCGPSRCKELSKESGIAVTDSLVTIYDSADESSVCSTSLPPLKKLDGVESIYGPKTIKSILRSKSTFKAEALKSVIINEPSSAPAKGNKSSPASKVYSAPAGKLKSVKIKDDPPLAIVLKELNNLNLQFSKNHSSYSRILFCKSEKTDHRTCDHVEYISTINMSQHLKSLGRASSRSKIPRPSKCFFLPCTHVLYYHLSNNVYTIQYWIMWKLRPLHKWSNRIISLKREIFQEDPYNMHSKDVKFVVVQLIPQLITMILNSSKEVKYFKPKSVTSGIPTGSSASKAATVKNKGLIAEAYEWDEEEVSSDDNEMVEFKVLMALAEENDAISKEGSRNGEWVKISMRKALHATLKTVYIHNHKDHLGKFDEKADDGYLLGYSLVSKAFRVFNTRRQQTEETYRITFDESPDAIKFSRSSVKTSTLMKLDDIHLMNIFILMNLLKGIKQTAMMCSS